MPILIHILLLAALCLFGYSSNDSFELLITGLAGLIFAHIMASEFNVSGKIQVSFSRILKIKESLTEDEIKMLEQIKKNIEKMDNPLHGDKITCIIYVLVSSLILLRSIFSYLGTN